MTEPTAAGPWKVLYDDYDAGTVFVTRDPQRTQSPLVEGLTIEQGTAVAAALNEAEAASPEPAGEGLRTALEDAVKWVGNRVSVVGDNGQTMNLLREEEVLASLGLALYALPPSAPPALDVERLRTALLVLFPDMPSNASTRRLYAERVAAEYARLQEPVA